MHARKGWEPHAGAGRRGPVSERAVLAALGVRCILTRRALKLNVEMKVVGFQRSLPFFSRAAAAALAGKGGGIAERR